MRDNLSEVTERLRFISGHLYAIKSQSIGIGNRLLWIIFFLIAILVVNVATCITVMQIDGFVIR